MGRRTRSTHAHKRLRLTAAEANRSLCPSKKRAYQTQSAALNALKNMKETKEGIEAQTAYFCRHCGKFHTTKKV